MMKHHDENKQDAEGFIRVARSADVRPNRMKLVEVNGRPLVLTRMGGRLIAFSALCPHQLGKLDSGTLNNGEVECPQHGWRFDVQSGVCTYPGDDDYRLRRYASHELDGDIYLKIN